MKRNIKIIILIVLFLIAAFIGWRCYFMLKKKEKISEVIQKLPSLNFTYLKKGNDFESKPTIINYFSPDCEYCQYMTKQLILNPKAFSSSAFIMVTNASRKRAEDFSNEYKLEELSFLSIAIDSLDNFYKAFGVNSIPNFFIYSKNHVLVKSIIGETKIDTLIAEIK